MHEPHSHPGSPQDRNSSQWPQDATFSMNPRASRLFWACWIILGGGFFILFLVLGVTALALHDERHVPDATEQTVAQEQKAVSSTSEKNAESELLRMDDNAIVKPAPEPIGEVDRVLGHGMNPPNPEDRLLLMEPPPPLPPPAPKPLSPHETLPSTSSNRSPPITTKPPDTPPPPAPKPASSRSETEFAKRLQVSEEELRSQLASIAELRLFSDIEIQNFRQTEQESQSGNRADRTLREYAFNLRLNRAMRQAALHAGLPVMSGSNCQLDPMTATIVQTLSKDLRDMGFVSIPGTPVRVRFSSGRVANVGGTTIAKGSPDEKIEAFKQWCDNNRIEKFRGALATLMQMLQVEDAQTRLLLVRELARIEGSGATAALAKRALADLAPDVRQAALDCLKKRPVSEYSSILLHALRYPWPPIADHAAVALRTLKPNGVVPYLVHLLDQPDPCLPYLDPKTKKPTLREVVRLNHLRNCLLCHAPSDNTKDGMVRGLVPTPGQALPRLYYSGQSGNFVRADITFLRQDFSVNLPAPDAVHWPKEQRFDFISRTRPLKPEELKEITQAPSNYPQRDAVLHALRGLTGKDAGDSTTAWRTMLGLAKDKALERTEGETKTGVGGKTVKSDTIPSIPKETTSEGKIKNRQP